MRGATFFVIPLVLAAVAAAFAQLPSAEDLLRSVVTIHTDKARGSGFVIDSSGYIVTNSHVIEEAEAAAIWTEDGEFFCQLQAAQSSVRNPRIAFTAKLQIDAGWRRMKRRVPADSRPRPPNPSTACPAAQIADTLWYSIERDHRRRTDRRATAAATDRNPCSELRRGRLPEQACACTLRGSTLAARSDTCSEFCGHCSGSMVEK